MYGQGRVFKRHNIWWVAWYDAQGHEQRESSRSPDKAVATQLLRQRLATSTRPIAEHHFEHIAALYLQDHSLRGPRSREWAEDRVNNLATVFAAVRIDRITSGDMRATRSNGLPWEPQRRRSIRTWGVWAGCSPSRSGRDGYTRSLTFNGYRRLTPPRLCRASAIFGHPSASTAGISGCSGLWLLQRLAEG